MSSMFPLSDDSGEPILVGSSLKFESGEAAGDEI